MHFKIPWKTCNAKPVSVSKWSQTSRPANFEGHIIPHNCILYVWMENATSLRTRQSESQRAIQWPLYETQGAIQKVFEIRTKYLLSHCVRLFYFVCNEKERNWNLGSHYLHKSPRPFAVKGTFISPISSKSQWLPAIFVVCEKFLSAVDWHIL